MVDRPIKFRCPNCNHVQPKSWGELAVGMVITLFLVFGIIFVVQLFIMGPVYWMNNFSSSIMTLEARQNPEELRTVTLGYTTYDGSDSFKFARDLAENLPRVRYVRSSLYSEPLPLANVTLNEGGDCKASSAMFVGMLHSAGHDALVDCSARDHHCVAKIPYFGADDRDEYMIVDLTTDFWAIYKNGVDHWTDVNNFVYAEKMRKVFMYEWEKPNEFDRFE